MSNLLVTGLAAVGFGAFGCLLGYLFERKRAYSRGYSEGVRDRENEIFTDYVIYMSNEEMLDIIHESMGDTDKDVPWLVIRPDRYDYIDGNGFDINKLNLFRG